MKTLISHSTLQRGYGIADASMRGRRCSDCHTAARLVSIGLAWCAACMLRTRWLESPPCWHSTLHPPLGTPRCILRLLHDCVEVELSGSTSWIGCAGVGTDSRIPRYSHRPVVASPVVSPSRKISRELRSPRLGSDLLPFGYSSLRSGGLNAVPHEGRCPERIIPNHVLCATSHR